MERTIRDKASAGVRGAGFANPPCFLSVGYLDHTFLYFGKFAHVCMLIRVLHYRRRRIREEHTGEK